MTRLPASLDARLRRDAPDFDTVARETPDVDVFCSTSPWVTSAWDAFHPDCEPLVQTTGSSRIALVRGHSPGIGPYLMPGEGVWALAAPVVGPDPHENAARLFECVADTGHGAAFALLTGFVPRSETLRALLRRFRHHRGRLVDPVTRHVASLEGGVDGFLSRRSRKFRANLRRIDRRASETALTATALLLDAASEVAPAYERAMAIEAHSWKTAAGNGVGTGPMRGFTRGVLTRSVQTGARALFVFVQRGGDDVGYLHGVIRDRYFRGLQMSFDDSERGASIGNLLQWHAIQALCAQDVLRYDLGSTLPYKSRWSEEELVTTGLLVGLA